MPHSLSHMVNNAISLECGYLASSIKEWFHAIPDHGYGIVLYTAEADSYGTLSGLAHAARLLDHYLSRALESAQLCSNDPDIGEARQAAKPDRPSCRRGIELTREWLSMCRGILMR